MLRDIQSIRVIPRRIFDMIFRLFEQYKEEKNNKKRSDIKREIEKYSVNVKITQVYNNYSNAPYIDGLYITNLEYDEEIGLVIKKI